MPISRYDIVVATHPKELNALMADGGYVAIGHIYAQPSYGLQAVGEGEIEPWGSVTEYELIQAQFYQDLIPLVNAKIADGYQPIGGLAHWANAFVQAVGKVDASGESGSGSGGGNDIELPEGDAFEVLGFDANKELKALHSGMAQWLGKDEQLSGVVGSLIPGIEVTPGQKVSTGKPRFYGVTNGTTSISIPIRDSGGVLTANPGTNPKNLTTLKQVQDLIAEAGVGVEPPVAIYPSGNLFEVMSFNDKGNPTAKPMSMEIWAGKALAKYNAAMEFVPSTMFDAGGDSANNVMRPIEAQPMPSSIAFRDAYGRLGVADAIEPQQAINKKQLEEILAVWRKDIEDNIINVINGAIGK